MKKHYLHYGLTLLITLFFITDLSAQFFENGEIGVSLSGAGRVRVYKDSTGAPIQIDRSSILVGTSPNAVFGYNQDAQNLDPVVTIENPLISYYEIYGSADNSYNDPPLPPNVISKANVYGWLTGGFTLVKFTILNKETSNINAVVGMEVICEPSGSYGLETIKWIDTEKIISFFRQGEASYVGYKLLSSELTTLSSIDWYSDYDMVDSDLWNWMTAGTITPVFDAGGDGSVAIFSQNAVNINLNDSTTFWVGISVGDTESEMLANMNLAISKYNTITSVESDLNNIPLYFTLEQNYPNPFNPSTKISFGLPERSNVVLKVFNTLGQQVAELVNESLEAGKHNYNFDASKLTSGVYVYSLQTDAGVISKKMTLIK
ncbi:MAG TPA: T9SS type A sorting domain-containing protein [Ignavibacteriaceae bacterium]|nr:T9SS type A sorting domain-containing protein [Ignavibacteriaceae bacterium]